MKIQYGCGLCAPETWTNYDASPTLRLQRLPLVGKLFQGEKYAAFPANVQYGNIAARLPLPDGVARIVYCSHVLEHLALDEFRSALRETYRILEPGGCFRFVLPDLAHAVQYYLACPPESRAIRFIESIGLGATHRPRSLSGFVREWLAGNKHCWMWDYDGIRVELEQAGFTQIRRATFSDSDISDFAEVEDKNRWADSLGAECKKPGP